MFELVISNLHLGYFTIETNLQNDLHSYTLKLGRTIRLVLTDKRVTGETKHAIHDIVVTIKENVHAYMYIHM